jgi:hypothetical protein
MNDLCKQLSEGTGLDFKIHDDEPFAVGKYDYFLITFSDGSINVGVFDAWDMHETVCANTEIAIAHINGFEKEVRA